MAKLDTPVLVSGPNGPPLPRTRLVGRDVETGEVAAAVRTARLVTLTGPGGVGKSRLAIAAVGAGRAAREARGCAVWVDLSGVTDPRLVADTVRRRFGAPEAPGVEPVRLVAELVRDAEVLLCLDNCEHLVTAVAEFVDRLLDDCPALRVLATSREPLQVSGEAVWPVAPLPVPPLGARLEEIRSCPAAQLFELRAQAVLPAFRVVAADARSLVQLCRGTGGLPLAIELAAARVRLLSVEQIVTGLDGAVGVLEGGPRTGPARQRSVRAALDWSHDLLTGAEQVVLRRLSVFPGGFDLAAAETVCAGGLVPGPQVRDLLGELVDKSLVTSERSGPDMRYRLLAPIRRYARRKLLAAGEERSAGDAHLSYYAALVTATEPWLAGTGQAGALQRLEQEGNNLRVALAHAASSTRAAEAGVRLAAGLWRFCALRGHYREGRQWLDWAASAASEVAPALRPKALLGSGGLAHLQCDYPGAVSRLEAALTGHRDIGDRAGMAATLQALGSVAREQGHYGRAEALHRESLALATADGDAVRMAQCHNYLGFVAWLQGHWAEAERQCGTALGEFRRLGDLEGQVWAQLSLGVVARYRGDEHAAELLWRARTQAEQLGYREALAWTSHELGALALGDGGADAQALLRSALDGHRRLGDRWRMASVLEDLADCAARREDDEHAVALLGAAAAVREQIGTVLPPCERPDHERVAAVLRARFGPDEFARRWGRGRLASLDDLLTGPSRSVQASARSRAAGGPNGNSRPNPLRVHVLGEVSVDIDGRRLTPSDWGYGKPRELLVLLLSSPPRTKSEIGRALWPDLDDARLRNAFHTALRDLRRALGDPSWVVFSAGRYGFARDRAHWCDLEVFEEGLAAARSARPALAALSGLQRAIAAYGGPLGADLPDSGWLQQRREDVARSYARALAATGRLLTAADRHREAAEVFRRAVAHDPLDEAAHRALMTALRRVGETGQAARVYERLVDRLRDEVGVAPAPETTAVYRQLARPS